MRAPGGVVVEIGDRELEGGFGEGDSGASSADPRGGVSSRERIAASIHVLDEAFREEVSTLSVRGPVSDDLERRLRALASGLRVALRELGTSLGECQKTLPYASMYWIRRPDGTEELCCGHDPAHCSRR